MATEPPNERPTLSPRNVDHLAAALAAAETIADADGWDLPPRLYGLFTRSAGTAAQVLDLDATLTASQIWQLADPRQPGTYLSPAVTLEFISEAIETALANPLQRLAVSGWLHAAGRRCLGFAFRCYVRAAGPGPDYLPGEMAVVANGANADARLLTAVDVDHRLYQIVRRRDQLFPDTTVVLGPSEQLADTIVVSALSRLVSVTRAL
jgi:hypothetical protein